MVEVSVTVQGGELKKIDIIKDTFSRWERTRRAFVTVPDNIVQHQSLDVDAVTGATVSSDSIKQAVYNALRKATK